MHMGCCCYPSLLTIKMRSNKLWISIMTILLRTNWKIWLIPLCDYRLTLRRFLIRPVGRVCGSFKDRIVFRRAPSHHRLLLSPENDWTNSNHSSISGISRGGASSVFFIGDRCNTEHAVISSNATNATWCDGQSSEGKWSAACIAPASNTYKQILHLPYNRHNTCRIAAHEHSTDVFRNRCANWEAPRQLRCSWACQCWRRCSRCICGSARCFVCMTAPLLHHSWDGALNPALAQRVD